MYHAIVRRRIRGLFDAINRGDTQPILDAFAPEGEHVFLGADHALAGRRDRPESIRAWYQRLMALTPDIHFDLHRIDIAGTPWNTIASIEWTERNSGTDGIEMTNHGVHVVHLRWGKMTRLLILTDTIPLVSTLQRSAESSGGMSLAAPIDDRPGWPAN
ncbi:Ketosteroid isomerase-related protein [Paracoccus isoporae]|uniref:Ketosteroid isomerase-related protein n=1 Tax=Paracoccus isoporae TaxID=591205 RepID=A0A1G7EBP3_9RHOB|nr:nuclear transport factor 2 family protein [Paracoccus isoporae]SDE61078.1 Ketosteroid isomerase-related protein [Paracoccus isoporae]